VITKKQAKSHDMFDAVSMVATAKITELNEWKTTFMVPATAPAEPIEMQPVPTMVQLSPHLVTLRYRL
jgi:hypothetical protein